MGTAKARLICLASFSALQCATPVLADDSPYKKVRGWSLYRNETNCSAYMMFENGEAVGFAYDAPGRSTRVTFSDAHAASLKDGDSPTIDMLLRKTDGTVDHAWEGTVFMVSVDRDGRRTLTSRWLGPPALENFRTAAFIGFFNGNREIGVFNLAGTAAALEEMQHCAMRLHDIDPRDAFAD